MTETANFSDQPSLNVEDLANSVVYILSTPSHVQVKS